MFAPGPAGRSANNRSAARRTRSRSASTAATRATSRAEADNPLTRSPKSRAPTGSGSGSGSRPASCAGVRRAAISPRASGFAPVSVTSSRFTWAGSTPWRDSSSSAAADSARPRTSTVSGTPLTGASPRTANTIAIRSAPNRLAANTSASAEARSTHWKSSTTQISPSGAAASASSESTPAPTRNRSPAPPAASPRAARTASRCGSGSASSEPATGRNAWCSAANARSDSDSTPVARNTRIAPPRSAAASSKALLPAPASPRNTTAPPKPPRARAITSSSALISADLP